MFAVGDKVVCVDFSPHPLYGTPTLKAGRVYIISEVGGEGWTAAIPNVAISGIKLFDAPNAPSAKGFWGGARFRKIQPGDPEFIELLNRIKPKVDA